jgi:predicted NUDIX family NTP pyrophosphohydrolase
VPTTSAGLLLFRVRDNVLQVLIGHMGGPFWARKDEAAWSIPKGERAESDLLTTARREFEEELGCTAPTDGLEELGAFRQPSGKVVWIWAVEGDLDASRCRSNTFELEWPRGSGRITEVPEMDRAEWVDVARARTRLVRGQVAALDELVRRVRVDRPEVSEGVGAGVAPGS